MNLLPDFDGMDDDLVEDGDEDLDGEVSYDPPLEYGIDYNTGQLTGKIVEGVETIKTWIWCTLHTERFKYAIHDWDYGIEIEPYMGTTVTQEILDTDIKKEIQDALYINPWITDINNWNSSIEKEKVHLKFTVDTDFGETEVDEFV